VPGVAGLAQVVKETYPDYTAWDSKHPYFDPKSDPKNPKWFMPDVGYVRHFKRFIPLKELQSYKDGPLKSMQLLTRGRLSVQSVSPEEFQFILDLEQKEPPS
jgi:predicted RNA-binding protein with PUA-like domain